MSKLPNAPLQEVIFEVRWELPFHPETNQASDPNYFLAVGKLSEYLKDTLPLVKKKFPDDWPIQMLHYQTAIQFWSGEQQWPAMQLGPGIFSVNQTEAGYVWNEYYELVRIGMDKLVKAYEGEINFNFSLLRYIDRVNPKDYAFEDWKQFIEKHLKFSFDNAFNTHGQLKAFHFEQLFEMDNGSQLQIALSSGKDNVSKEDMFILQTAVIKQKETNAEELMNWCNEAHQVTSGLFKEICKDELYNSFG